MSHLYNKWNEVFIYHVRVAGDFLDKIKIRRVMKINLLHYLTLKDCRILHVHIGEVQKVRRDLEVLLSTLLKSHLESVAQDHIQMAFDCPEVAESTMYLGNLLECAVTAAMELFLHSCLNGASCVSVWVLFLWSCRWAPLSLAPSSLCLPLKYLCALQDPLEPFLLYAK